MTLWHGDLAKPPAQRILRCEALSNRKLPLGIAVHQETFEKVLAESGPLMLIVIMRTGFWFTCVQWGTDVGA